MRPRADHLAEQIADAILVGTLSPGMHLDEHALADHFGVSRTPVRDALRQLSGTGLIETRPYMGAWVRKLSTEEITGLFVAMAEVEASCARLSALSMTEEERTALQNLHAGMKDLATAADRAGYVEANRAFHGLLYAGAHNATLSEMALSLRRRLTPYRTAQFQLAGRLPLSYKEHDRVVRAVLTRDGNAANTAMLAHMRVVEEAFEAQDVGQSKRRSETRTQRTQTAQWNDVAAVGKAKPLRS